MATSEDTPKSKSPFSRYKQPPIPNQLSADRSCRRLSAVTASESSTPARTPLKKKARYQSADEILKQLARDAVQEMEIRGFSNQSTDSSSRDDKQQIWDSRIGDRYDYILSGSYHEGEHEEDLEEPLSPLTFLNRIGLKESVRKKPKRHSVIKPPIPPPILDAGTKGASLLSDPSSCTTPESGSSRRRSKRSLGEITPATARAAQCLLDLTR